MPLVNELLLELFRAHGVDAEPQGDWIVFVGKTIRAKASVVGETAENDRTSIQLDVRLETVPGRTVIESFAGIGQTRDKAIADAFSSFAATTFHVLLAVYFGCEESPHASQEEWAIGGRTGRVTVGDVGVRGKPPVQGEELVGWFGHLRENIQEKQLRPGTHWVRLFYGQMQGRAMACEVLLNNRVWEEVQAEMAAVEWPSGQEFYSVRVFLVLQVQTGGSVSPESAVAWLADIVADWDDFSEAEVYTAMVEAGVPGPLADRAYTFTQTAWGRAYLAGLGVQFSPEYVCFNASGQVVESGHLADEPCFVTASRLAERYAGARGFKQLALMAADVNVVNKALNGGAKAEDLTLAPVFVQLEPLTPEGSRNFQLVVDRYLASLRKKTPPGAEEPAARPARPWWRFWS